MSEKISKEHIVQIVGKTLEELNFNITNQFTEAINKLDTDSQNNPVCREIAAVAIAQSNSVEIMTEVLYKLLNE
jgi:hypothetical protein